MTPTFCCSTWAKSFGSLSLDVRHSCNRQRGKGAPGQAGGLRLGGRRVRRLPSGARSRGPSPNSLRSLRSATFKQAATSQFTKRAARAGHEPCAPQRLRGALRPVRAHLCRNVFGVRRKSQRGDVDSTGFCSSWQTLNVGSAAGGTRQGRFLGRRGAQGQGRRAQRASISDSRALLERSERSERSEFDRATLDRAPQRSRRTRRPPRHEPLPGTACRAAQTPREIGRARSRQNSLRNSCIADRAKLVEPLR